MLIMIMVTHINTLDNCFAAASSTVVLYDWALTFGQEFELIFSQRWSFMTVLYICVRCIGILFSAINILSILPVLITDAVSLIIWYVGTWAPVIVNAMLGVAMIARLNAMYQGSKRLLIFLVITLLACTIISGVTVVIENSSISAQEAVLSGFYTCITYSETNLNLIYESLIPTSVWEILALFLTIWIVVKHFCELRQSPTGSSIGNCLKMLIESHTFYFLAFAIVASLRLGSLSNVTNTTSVGSAVYSGIWSIAEVLQMFVLGPRLILSIREYHAKLVARADGETWMMSISALQIGEDALTGRDVDV
ncbi:hypothetical protein BDR07DRAFT_393459 [Suillus spraguei]|nr:hypothetical protein BDR07DRAFT_393459 [Suillus spraguei]